MSLIGQQTRNQEFDVRASANNLLKKQFDLDPQCLSCAGNPNEVKKTFKLACLSYNPQPINYRERRIQCWKMIVRIGNVSHPLHLELHFY
jgi:hypothetical protein